MVLLFGRLSNCEELRDFIATITSFKLAFHHPDFGKNTSRSDLSRADEMREAKIFQEFADKMVSVARGKQGVVKGFFILNNVYAFNSSTISLYLSVYWWIKPYHGKGGVKLHEPYDMKTDILIFSVITDVPVHDSQVMELILYKKESFYILDRACMVIRRPYIIEEAEAYFVIRGECKMSFEVIRNKEYNNPSPGIMVDQIIRFKGHRTKEQYPNKLRRVVFYDYNGNRTSASYTNNFEVTAEQIAMLYKHRWKVEPFLEWLKQYLRIKEFYETSENVVEI